MTESENNFQVSLFVIPHLFMDDLYQPIPTRRRFSKIDCHGRSSLFATFLRPIRSIHSGVWTSPTPSCKTLPSKHLWTCPQVWHGSFLVPPYCMTEGTCVWMRFAIVVPCRWCLSCFVAFIARMRLAAFLMAIPVRTRSWNTWVGLRHPDMVNMALFMLTPTLTCGVLLQTVTCIQAAEKTRAWVEFRNVITHAASPCCTSEARINDTQYM